MPNPSRSPAEARSASPRSCGGATSFSIWALDGSLEQTDLLIDTIGGYLGTVLIPDGTANLEIRASEYWRIEVNPLAAARSFSVGDHRGVAQDLAGA